MIKAVSFQGTQPTQPVTEKKEPKKTHAAAGVVVGALAGGLGSYFTDLGKVSQYKDADAFISSAKMEEELTNVPSEKAPDVALIKAEKVAMDAKTKDVDAKLEAIFTKEAKDDAEKPVSEVLNGIKKDLKLEDIQKTVADKAEEPLKADEAQLKTIQEKAKTLEKSKSEIIGESKKDAEVVNVVKGADDKVTVVKGKMVEDGAPDKFKFEPHTGDKAYSKELAEHEKAITDVREAFTTNKKIADKLGIKSDTVADFKVKKSVVKTYLEDASKELSPKAKTAFENIQAHLPKTVSNKMVAMYAAGGAVVLGLIGHMMKKKEA
jgi:hypothetical protein